MGVPISLHRHNVFFTVPVYKVASKIIDPVRYFSVIADLLAWPWSDCWNHWALRLCSHHWATLWASAYCLHSLVSGKFKEQTIYWLGTVYGDSEAACIYHPCHAQAVQVSFNNLKLRSPYNDNFVFFRNLPANLSMISKLSYNPNRQIVNFYAKLFQTFGVTNAPSELLTYPKEFADLLNRSEAAYSPINALPPSNLLDSAASAGVLSNSPSIDLSTSNFSDLQTISTTVTELEADATTTSRLSTMSLDTQLPSVPTHEPGGTNASATVSPSASRSLSKENSKKSKSRSSGFFKALTKPLKKGNSYLAE